MLLSRRSRQIIIILLVAVSVLMTAIVYVITEGRLLTRADVTQIPATPEFGVTVLNPQKTVSPSGVLSYTVEVKNSSPQAAKLAAFIAGYGIKYQPSESLNDRQLKPDEIRLLSARQPENAKSENSNFLYWDIGSLDPNQSATRVVQGALPDISLSEVLTQIKLFKIDEVRAGCLGQKCLIDRTLRQAVAETFQSAKIEAAPRVTLKRQYNLFTVPYALSPAEISSFITGLNPRWAWTYDSKSSSFIDLVRLENQSRIQPGVGIWLYSEDGGQVTFPAGATALKPDDNVSLQLYKGWNQLGNPYTYPMIVSGTDIVINKPQGSEGPALVNNYQDAVGAKQISPFYLYISDSKGNNGRFEETQVGKTILMPYDGFWVYSNEDYVLQFTGSKVTNPGENLTQEEKDQIQAWIKKNGLNSYGDPQGTVYAGGTPLFDERTGKVIDLYVYIVSRHPDRPWKIKT